MLVCLSNSNWLELTCRKILYTKYGNKPAYENETILEILHMWTLRVHSIDNLWTSTMLTSHLDSI